MDARSLKSELLKLFPVFAEMSAPEADRILSVASRRTVKAGTALFFAGNPPLRRYVFALFSTVREMVGRVLRNFEDRGLVALGREQVRIIDPERLRAILDGPMASRP